MGNPKNAGVQAEGEYTELPMFATGIVWEHMPRTRRSARRGGAGFRTGAVILCRRWRWQRGATVDLPYVLQDDL